ncbi:MAG: CPXCG motif-containing cysteine-rich protein [Proteobacteria bacterium]|nr:CPXCG motif-containing cysteine-rich protein [Pseudomonadota bacterium]
MNILTEQIVQCPYCGENIDLLVDQSVPQQTYVEDCQVCCRPINFDVAVDPDGSIEIKLTNENE